MDLNRDLSHNWRFRHRFRPHSHRGSHKYQPRFGHTSDAHFIPFSNRFRQSPKSFGSDPSITQMNKPKPKYDTLIIDLPEGGHHVTEKSLKQYFQQNYGTIKKIIVNVEDRKAFISFYDHTSVDMCVESGVYHQIDGTSLRVYPLEVESPQELLPKNGGRCVQTKSNNINLSAAFPLIEDFKSKQIPITCNIDRKELIDLIKVEKIDKKKLFSDLLYAKDSATQIDTLIDTMLLEDYDYERRFRLKDIIEEVLNANHFECKLHFFGSTINGLAFRDSDIDIFIELPVNRKKTFEESMASLKRIQNILRNALKMFVSNPIPSTRCPLVKLNFNSVHAIRNSSSQALVCDISLTNQLALRNSQLIKLYCRLDSRFQKMCLALKLWAKDNEFIGTNYMSSYAFTHLVLFFFQREQLLPSVDGLRQLSPPKETIVIDGWDCSFNDSPDDYTIDRTNSDSIVELLKRFFCFYANFDFSSHIICTKTGLTKHKSQSLPQIEAIEDVSKESFRLTSIICIEDPFELTHNLCGHLNYRCFDKFCEYIDSIWRKSKDIFTDKPPEKGTEKASKDRNWSLCYLCCQWDPTPNGYVFPENYIGFTHLDVILSQSSEPFIQVLANRLIHLTHNWLSNVYRIDLSLLSKWHLIGGQMSPFVEFYIKVRANDRQVIDPMTRMQIRHELGQQLSGLSLADSEAKVTEEIIARHSTEAEDNTAFTPVDCHFALVINCRTTFPTVELALIDIRPSSESPKAHINFLRRVIATAANEDRVLTCPPEFISQ